LQKYKLCPLENNIIDEIQDRRLVLPNNKIIILNDQQYEAIKKIRIWLKSNKQFFTLSGFSGTGKSTILKKILDEYRGGVVVTGPTHKSRKVVENYTKKESKTIQALLGLRPDVSIESFSPNFPIFNPIAQDRINEYNLVCIDEASMINSSFFNLIVEKTKENKTKILFIGDYAQIPPISEERSIVFHNPDIEMYELTKVERQGDTNPLFFTYDALRNNLTEPDGGFLRKSNMNSKGEGIYFTLDKSEFRSLMLEKFKSEEFKNDINYCKVIAWRNETVMKSNKIIRDEIIGKKLDVVEVNDVIMGYRTISTKYKDYNIIENSADYKVTYKGNLTTNKYGIGGYLITIQEDLGNNKYKTENVFVINSQDEDIVYTYAEEHDRLRDQAKVNKKLWNMYYDFRRDNLIISNIYKYRNGEYRANNDVIVKDLDYGFSLSAHKSQGSTFTHCFVIESDINKNRLTKEKNQILYTSLSRPTTSATVLTSRIDE